MEEEQLS